MINEKVIIDRIGFEEREQCKTLNDEKQVGTYIHKPRQRKSEII